MNEQEQRIAIAEACGIVSKNQWGSLYKTRKGVSIECPDYCNDLNEMHEAESFIMDDDPHAYGCYACNLYEEYGNTVHLTAAQRAEAFLRTVGKWTTSPNE
jgi:hypothetical protein